MIDVKHCVSEDTDHAPAHRSLRYVEDPGENEHKDAIKVAYPYSLGVGWESYTNSNGASLDDSELILWFTIQMIHDDRKDYIQIKLHPSQAVTSLV